jgi:hypothetical protein
MHSLLRGLAGGGRRVEEGEGLGEVIMSCNLSLSSLAVEELGF